ncbi:MAG TPA: hypothetical protein VLL25_06075 [Acidimicrobiales bacterium]|nr:hypothetical protein [Acidimicrobiales bacterium]
MLATIYGVVVLGFIMPMYAVEKRHHGRRRRLGTGRCPQGQRPPVQEGLLTVGITPAEFDAYLAALGNPHVIIGSPVLISASGRRS